MILCLVTDRRRLGAAMGAPASEWVDALHQQVAAAAEAGIDFVQVREPDLEARELAALVRSLMRRVAAARRRRILVNDRLDVALAAGAAGVHLKEALDPARRGASDSPRRASSISCAVHGTLPRLHGSPRTFSLPGTVLPTVVEASSRLLEWEGLSRGGRGSGRHAGARDRRTGSTVDSVAGS